MTSIPDQARFQRAIAINEIRNRFLDRGFPRLVVGTLMAAAGGAAFLTSYALLGAGVRAMSIRYASAAIVGYVVLLGLFRLWLAIAVRRASRGRDDSSLLDLIPDGLDVVDVTIPIDVSVSTPTFGGGGGFGGGGTSRSWGAASRSFGSDKGASSASSDGGSGLDLDLDEGWVIVIPIIALVAIGIGAATVVWGAPMLLAELLLDGLVAAGVYRRLKRVDAQHWLAGATKRTWLPAIGVIIVAGVAGWLIQFFAPAALSIGDLWR